MSHALIIIDLINDIVGKNGLSNSSYPQVTSRNIVIKPHKDAKPSGDKSGELKNPAEV